MRVLGLAPDVWISSAALVEDGRVVAAAPEERFTRQKQSKAFPARALDYCLRAAGCSLDDVDRIAIAWNPGVHLRSASPRFLNHARWRGEYLINVPGNLLHLLGNPDVDWMEQVVHAGGRDVRIAFVNHHDAHAASAFFLSPYDRAAVLTVDGRGERQTATWGAARGTCLERLQAVDLPHSLGEMYSAVTEFLGFRPYSDEWKVMALASYGRADSTHYGPLRSLVELLDEGRFELDLSCFTHYLFDMQPSMYTAKLVERLGPARSGGDPIEARHYDIAAALQRVFEETFAHMLNHLHRLTGEHRLVLAGGCAMNSVYNGKIAATTPFREVFIPSCPDDSGVSVGAALYGYHCLLEGTTRAAHADNYWGPAFSDAEIADTLQKYKLAGTRHERVEQDAAALLAQGKLIGWFQGRMEFGQRALGNRSILADPRNASVRDAVNAAVKYRESFRPFAPAVLEEHAGEYFQLPAGVHVPFMERVFPVRPERAAQIPAVIHVDGSGRLQTVSAATNPRFHALIKAFQGLTGVPVVLNTSFNLNGEPIVCTPTDAVRTFFSCGLDALVIGEWIVRKAAN